MPEQYQPEWVRGAAVSEGVRPCADRWEILSGFLGQYERPFTILDLGANLAYFSLRATESFDCTAVAVESGYAEWMGTILRENDNPRVIGLDCKITPAWLEHLGTVEHFDVVLALSVLHHLPAPFTESLALCQNLGDHVIVEPPTEPVACGAPVDDLTLEADDVLGLVSSHLGGIRPILHFGTADNRIIRTNPYLGSPRVTNVRIASDFTHKIVDLPRKDETRLWARGINLTTYLTCGGIWPTREHIAAHLPRPASHGDIRPWNYILAGDEITPIDFHDPLAQPGDDTADYQATVAAVLEDRGTDQMLGRFELVSA